MSNKQRTPLGTRSSLFHKTDEAIPGLPKTKPKPEVKEPEKPKVTVEKKAKLRGPLRVNFTLSPGDKVQIMVETKED